MQCNAFHNANWTFTLSFRIEHEQYDFYCSCLLNRNIYLQQPWKKMRLPHHNFPV